MTVAFMDAFEPLASMIGSIIVFHFRPQMLDYVASIMIIFAVIALNWTPRDLGGLAFFSVSDTTLSQFAADVLPTFARGVLPLLAHAPVKACQALMDLVTGTGILDLLTSSSTRLDGAEEESGFDEEGWFDEEESFDEESWFDEEGSGIDWDDDSLYE